MANFFEKNETGQFVAKTLIFILSNTFYQCNTYSQKVANPFKRLKSYTLPLQGSGERSCPRGRVSH